MCSATVLPVMGEGTGTLPTDVGALQQLVVRQQKEISTLEEKVQLLLQKIFGRRSEQLNDKEIEQGKLFDEVGLEPHVPEPAEPMIEVPAHKRGKPGRKPIPPELPRREVLHEIPEADRSCGCCGQPLERIGEEATEQLEYTPAKLEVLRHIRPKLACKNPDCEGLASARPVKIAPPPPQIIEKSIAGPGLLAHVLVSKFCDAIPFYRQEKLFARIGVELSRADFCNWAAQAALKCDPLIEIFLDEIRAGPVVQMDETRLQVMSEPGRENGTLSYMWVMRGGPPDKPLVVYRYHPSRSGSIPLLYLSDYHGFLQTDGYEGYAEVGALPGITHAGCWAHARRRFDEAAKASKNTGSAHEALGRIAKLYALDKQLRAKKLCPLVFMLTRKEQAMPILADFKTWLDGKADHVLPSALLGKAVSYAREHWEKLVRYLDSPYLTPDTNLVLCSGFRYPEDFGNSFVERANPSTAA